MTRWWIAKGILVAFALALCACGGGDSYRMAGYAPALGADGDLDVGVTDGGNRRVDLDVRHLPPPERLGAGLTTYGVWVHPAGGQPVLLGRLEYDDDDRRGFLQGVTPYRSFRLIVTAEPDVHAAAPTGVVVLEQHVDT